MVPPPPGWAWGPTVLQDTTLKQKEHWPQARMVASLLRGCETSGGCLDLSESYFSGLGTWPATSVTCGGHRPFPCDFSCPEALKSWVSQKLRLLSKDWSPTCSEAETLLESFRPEWSFLLCCSASS